MRRAIHLHRRRRPTPNQSETAAAAAPADRSGWPLGVYFVLLIVLMCAAAAAASVYVAVQAERDARHDAQSDARAAARSAARELGDGVAVLRATVANLAANPRIGEALQRPAECTLTFGGSGALASGHVDILRPGGAVACSSRPRHGGALSGYRGASWLSRARKAPVLLGPVLDSATGEQTLLAAAPIGRTAVVAAFADLKSLGPGLALEYGAGRPSEFLVTSGPRDVVLARSIDPGRWIGRALEETPFARASGHAERPDPDQRRRLYGEAPVGGVDWRVFVGEEKGAALAAGIRLRNRELAIILGGLVAMVLATLLIYRKVALPFKRLGTAVRASDPYNPATAPIPVDGPAEAAALATDINALLGSVGRELQQRRQLERQFRHAQKMEALGRVSAGVAHDFNNLVTVIGGFTSLILKSAGENEQLRAHAREVGRAAERAAVLIRQLLLFSRKETVATAVLDANAVVAGMEGMLQRVLGATIELVVQTNADPATVEADRGQLEQVLMNLAVNANDAMPTGGRLTVETETRVLEPSGADALALAAGAYVVVSVRDTGTGIDARTREHLFEPFFTTKEPGKGTGLGLSTCYGIVSELRGTIDVQSEPGRGSVFSVYLPLAEAPTAAADDAPAESGESAAAGTILLVEDDAGLRLLARTVLEDAGYTVLDARFGEEALWVADRHQGPIDLLLTDGVMPVMSGRELAERFAQLHHESRVLYMSGHEREAGPGGPPEDAFLAKPFTPETLLAAVRRSLGRSGAGAEL